jgi:hypothetical protein
MQQPVLTQTVAKSNEPESKLMKWVRIAIAIGLVSLLAGLVAGKITQGGLIAQILGIAGGGLIVGAALVAIIRQIVLKLKGGAPASQAQ